MVTQLLAPWASCVTSTTWQYSWPLGPALQLPIIPLALAPWARACRPVRALGTSRSTTAAGTPAALQPLGGTAAVGALLGPCSVTVLVVSQRRDESTTAGATAPALQPLLFSNPPAALGPWAPWAQVGPGPQGLSGPGPKGR